MSDERDKARASLRDFGSTLIAVGKRLRSLTRADLIENPATAKIAVDFKNAPKGTRATNDPSSTADVNLNVGYQMLGSF